MLTKTSLIGQIGALYLKKYLQGNTQQEGTARFTLSQLKGEQAAAIAHAILNDSELAANVDIKFPRHYVEVFNLPEEVLTDKRATYFRNAEIKKPILLIANIGDDEDQSMKMIMSIGTQELLAQYPLWMEMVSQGLLLNQDLLIIWESALKGLIELNRHPFDRIVDYLIATHQQIHQEGLPLMKALGAGLPALMLPTDTDFFEGIADNFRRRPSSWRKFYDTADRQRAPFLRKQTPNQTLLGTSDLYASFSKVKEAIPNELHPIVEAFIEAPDGWNDEAESLANCEWTYIQSLFTGLKREKTNLGQDTQAFFDNTDPDLLSTEDTDYLRRLAKRKSNSPQDEDKAFYEAHSPEFKNERKLKSLWDKFIHGSPIESEDFLEGILLCFERLFTSQENTSKTFRISLDRKSKNDLRDLNADAGFYFAFRYKGIKALLGGKVRWDVGELFQFSELFTGKYSAKYSTSKAALQLRFTLELTSETSAGNFYKQSTQLIWKFNPDTVMSEMPSDWERLVKQPFISCFASRETLSTKGSFQSIDLYNTKTFVPTYDKNRGSFVPVARPANNIAKRWQQNLQEAQKDGLIAADVEKKIQEKWKVFETSYRNAVEGFISEGMASAALFEQAAAYQALLTAICIDAKGDKNRERLLKPLLALGSVQIRGGGTAEIIAPWHPLRLLAIGVKACRASAFVHHFLSNSNVQFGDTGRLFFKEVREELQHPFYPEVVIGWQENKQELLSLSDTCGDYTLHELPNVGGDGMDETSDNPLQGAARVVELVDRYVSLQPHEKSNLSVVLYNCDSARLPHAVVDKIGRLREEEEDFHCHVVLRHRDSQKLRHLYERIIETSDTDPDAYSASEATRDFMARLRIGISADQASTPPNADGPPNDIVFLQDVIARHAKIEWYIEDATPVDLTKLVPVRWSRKRPAAKDDMKSVVYLCCPGQTDEGWAYLTAITTFFKGDWDGNEQKRLLPARQLDFNEPNMRQIFTETHYLGNWVVNFDELIDRRQLANQGVRVIRYKQFSTQGRNLVVSSNAPLGLLKAMVHARIRSLHLEIGEEEQARLTDKFIQEANDISGDIVLRAAKRGRNASELMGIVLSRFLVRKEVERGHGALATFGWYFLDDYAAWLGQKEEQIADLLMLCPSVGENGNLRLFIVITEAKYVDFANHPAGVKNSRSQLRDTVRRFQEALYGDPERIDRELWLGRLADLILDGVQFPASLNVNLGQWRRAIREGTCEFSIQGYSHVFVSGPPNSPDVTSFSAIGEIKDGHQEVYGYERVRNLLIQYYRNEDPTEGRMAEHGLLGEEEKSYRLSSQSLELPYSCIALKTEGIRNPGLKEEGEPSMPSPTKRLVKDTLDRANNDPSIESNHPPGEGGQQETSGSGMLILRTEPSAMFWKYSEIAHLLDLEISTTDVDSKEADWLKSIESKTKQALQGLGLQAKLVSSKLTPNAALLKFQGSANLTLDQVVRKQLEFKTTYGLSVISIQPEPGVVALAIERPYRKTVSLEQVWKRWELTDEKDEGALPIAIREDDGHVLFLSPQKKHAPHTLIAGSTGSGKSVLMQNIILSIAAIHTPREAQIILIDPKLGVDYFALESLPHIKEGIIDTQENALSKLRMLVEEMDNRYRLFKEAKVSNLTGYNKKVGEKDNQPIIWLIHDGVC